MSKESRHRAFFLALAVLLGAFAIYSVVAVAVGVASDSYRHYRVVAVVIAIVLVLGLAVLAAWLARRSWQRAKSNLTRFVG
jgi:uncharacterized membrane protein YqjE